MRAIVLEIAGYDVQIAEWIGQDHTARNTMITALRAKAPPDADRARTRLTALAAANGLVSQKLATLQGEALSDSDTDVPRYKNTRRLPSPL